MPHLPSGGHRREGGEGPLLQLDHRDPSPTLSSAPLDAGLAPSVDWRPLRDAGQCGPRSRLRAHGVVGRRHVYMGLVILLLSSWPGRCPRSQQAALGGCDYPSYRR